MSRGSGRHALQDRPARAKSTPWFWLALPAADASSIRCAPRSSTTRLEHLGVADAEVAGARGHAACRSRGPASPAARSSRRAAPRRRRSVLNRANSWPAVGELVIEPHAPRVAIPAAAPRWPPGSGARQAGSAAGRTAAARRRSDRCAPGSICKAPRSPRRADSDGHRERARLLAPQPLALVAGEEEGPIAHERPAKAAAELMLPEQRHRLVLGVEVAACVEPLVAHELEGAAVQRVGPRAGGHVDQRRRLAAELRGVLRLLDLELLHRLRRTG